MAVRKVSNVLKTLYHYLAFIVKVTVLILLSPLFLLYVWGKSLRHKKAFKRELRAYGIDRQHVKALSQNLPKARGFVKALNFDKQTETEHA